MGRGRREFLGAAAALAAAGLVPRESFAQRVVAGRIVAADATTLDRKLMVGYQGWFTAPGDGSRLAPWTHRFLYSVPKLENAVFEYWEDAAEYAPEELVDTGLRTAGGAPARLPSPANAAVVRRHARWMREYGIDGFFQQRFAIGTFADDGSRAHNDLILANSSEAARVEGRVFAVMYDLSGVGTGRFGDRYADHIFADWRHLVDDLGVLNGAYVHHRGAPVVALWGLGFEGAQYGRDPAEMLRLQALFKHAEPRYRATLFGGVPTGWRTSEGDARADAAYQAVYAGFDVVSPWMVGRFGSGADAAVHARGRLAEDLAATRGRGQDYSAVVFPGFSWHNLMTNVNPVTGQPIPEAPYNQIPRRAGAFLWDQIREYATAGATMLYVAMFDEVDEGTAIFKLPASRNDVPAGWLALDADGEILPNDWYLRIAGAGADVLAGRAVIAAEPPPFGQRRDVAAIYREVLGREPDPGGLRIYIDVLARGVAVTEVRQVIANSDEAKFQIARIYREVLGREPDPGGLQSYVNALASGATLAGIRTAIAGSPEAQVRIREIYRALRRRNPRSSEMSAAINYLAAGGTLAGLRVSLGG